MVLALRNEIIIHILLTITINYCKVKLIILNVGDIMLFVCHSSLDRESIVKPLLYYLYNFGLDIWYDHKKLFLSDTISYDIYEKGIGECSDILIIYSQNLVHNSECGRKELDVIYKNTKSKNLYPVLYNSKMSDFDGDDFQIIKNTIHFTATENNLHQIAVQIIIKIIKSINDIPLSHLNIPEYDRVLNLYKLIPAFNLREKAILLITFIMSKKYDNNAFINKINIDTIVNDYVSKLHLAYSFSENDVKLLESLTVLIITHGFNY